MDDPPAPPTHNSVSQQIGTVLAANEFLKEQVSEVRADLRRNEDSSRALQREVSELSAAMKALAKEVAALAEPVNQYVSYRARLSSFGVFIGAMLLAIGVIVGPIWPDVLRKLMPWLNR
jgi:uncharacterized protein YlxW (UPF0749 family)